MKQPIEIGNLVFKTKKEEIEFFKEILNSYEIGETLTNEDFENVYHLLKKHPDSATKIGCGIKEIIVENGGYKYNCFHIIRTDLTKEDFSYRKCINGESSDFTIFSQACKKAIEADLKNVKQDYFKQHSKNGLVKCQETGEMVNYENSHIDHRQPNTFSVIVDRFIELKEIDISKIQYDKAKYGYRLIDKTIEQDFRNYHAEKANLRLVNGKNNLSRSYQGRINTQKKDLKIIDNEGKTGGNNV